MPQAVTELSDIQAIVASGYGSLAEAAFLLLRVVDAGKAKAWVGAVASERGSPGPSYRVTTVADLRSAQQPAALQLAFTAPGLRKLGVAEDVVRGFSREFYGGMAGTEAEAEGRSRRLGDLGASAPDHWDWGASAPPDVLVMAYAKAGALRALLTEMKADFGSAFEVTREFSTTYEETPSGDRLEPFGFIDGISQPGIDWKGERDPRGDQMVYGNLLAAGEFLLGYTNEYGLYEDRPLLEPSLDPRGVLAPAADEPTKRDLARNGSYLVFRHLEQDVDGFWTFVSARDPASDGVPLAESMVGRRLQSGEPVVGRSAATGTDGPQERDGRNAFTFDADPDGLACPFGAHIRRANPRTADLPGGQQGFVSWGLRMLGFGHGSAREDLVSSARFHRVVRRGRKYGGVVGRAAAARASGAESRSGLYFICLNANLSRQFEFIQNAWLMNPTFDGMSGEADPLLGNRLDWPAGHPTDSFTLPQSAGPCRRVGGLPQFVTVRGGAYFFLPSVRALRFFAQ